MEYHMLAACLFLVCTPAVVATTYREYTGNVYNSTQNGNYGGSHLDHCERSNSTFEQCQHWCTADCECECFTVFVPNGACFRRHSCDPSRFNNDSSDFKTYVKDNFTSNCTNFEDLGYDTKCAGETLPPLIATNIGSLEQCKSLCALLNFECKGIQYLSNCNDTAMDQCLIYTSQIGSFTAAPPEKEHVSHYHCLRYIGEEGNLTGGLIVPLSMGLHGLNGSALTSNPAVANIAGTFIKGVFANMSSHVTKEYVTVQIHEGDPMIADVQIEMQNETAFYEVVKSLQNGEDALKDQFVALLNNSALAEFTTGPLNITDLAFNFSQIEFLVSTITMSTTTETTTPCLEANNCTTTTTEIPVSRGNHHIPMLTTMLMWFAARFSHA